MIILLIAAATANIDKAKCVCDKGIYGLDGEGI